MKMRKHSSSEERPNGSTKIHNVRFYNLTARSIQCQAYNKIWSKLALSRKDGSIEIWDLQHAPCIEKTIPTSPGNSVEGLAWAGERLFSVGLSGELVEWNLQTMQPRYKQHVTGNAIWCVDVNALGTELAIATEEGFINIFDISHDQMQYKQLFDKQEGRILCCKFDASGEFLVTGSVGVIRIWDVRTGHALHRMSVAPSETHREVIVWSLQVLSDFTIISGDSRGQVCVWDGRMAAHVETHQVLKADVLSVAVNEEETMLICAGIDPVIRIYAKTQIKREDALFYRWVKYLQRNVHDHDVTSLVVAGDRILSGGMDGYLGISSVSKMSKSIAKYGPFLQNPCVTVAASSRLLLLRYTTYLEVWRLGGTTGKPDLQITDETEDQEQPQKSERKLLSLDTAPEKLLQLQSKHNEPIVCATLSPDGQWLCYSTQTAIRLFRFVPAVEEKNATQLARVKDLPEQFSAASHLHFAADSKRLFLVNAVSKQILIFSILANGISDLDFTESIETGKHIKDAITSLTVSQCGSYVVAAGADRTIAVWCVFQGKYFKHHLNLPRYTATTAALAIHAHQPRLVAAFTDGKVFEYDLEEMCFTCSEHNFFVDNASTHCVSNIVLDSRNPNVFILHNDAHLFVLEKCSPNASEDDVEDAGADLKKKSNKKPKRVVADEKVSGLRLKMSKSYEHFVHLGWLGVDELVAVGVNPISLIEQLPDAFKQKRFGTS